MKLLKVFLFKFSMTFENPNSKNLKSKLQTLKQMPNPTSFVDLQKKKILKDPKSRPKIISN